MDIMANYYSVKDRVKSTFAKVVPPSDWKVYTYKAKPADEVQRLRVNGLRTQETIQSLTEKLNLLLRSNRRLRTDLAYETNRVDILVNELSHLKQQVTSMSNSGMNETGEIVLTQDVPMPTYDNYDDVIERIEADIGTEFYNYYDTITTTEERRLYHAMLSSVKTVCNNLNTEISETLAGRQELADEYSDQFEFVENDDPGESKDC